MKVLLLAAGRSKRMNPIKDKNFLNFLGKPLIVHQLESLISGGFKEIIVVGGKHNLDKISDVSKNLPATISVVEQKDLELGMCGAILAAKEAIGEDSVLVVSSNDIVEENAFKLVKKAAEGEDAESYLLGMKVSRYFPGGYLEIDADGFIKNIVEKPGEGNEPSDLVNLVVHLHKNPQNLIEHLEKVKSQKDDLYEVALSEMMANGVKFRAVSYEGFWQPIKYPWHVHNVFMHLFSKAEKRISTSAKIAKSAVINGEVIIGDNVKIFDGAVINGPCYIGDNCVVATNALVRESHVGNDCVIGYITEVARSFLGDSVWFHSNYIGDSVIGDNVSFGAGCVTGNLRLDEKNVTVDYDGEKIDSQTNKLGAIIGDNVRVGVNTSIMPGARIGGGSFIGGGIVVSKNIPEKSFARGEFELKISENTFP